MASKQVLALALFLSAILRTMRNRNVNIYFQRLDHSCGCRCCCCSDRWIVEKVAERPIRKATEESAHGSTVSC
uniref:Putative secreted protein n=1 Tax=Anopheles darlingi TaxID=43151 RepID=A0A2M4D2V8_ANODA